MDSRIVWRDGVHKVHAAWSCDTNSYDADALWFEVVGRRGDLLAELQLVGNDDGSSRRATTDYITGEGLRPQQIQRSSQVRAAAAEKLDLTDSLHETVDVTVGVEVDRGVCTTAVANDSGSDTVRTDVVLSD